jgi:thiamine kinase-like enzyme
MWRLETTSGAFAVKEIALDSESAWTADRIERAFVLERAAFAAGISMPRPVRVAETDMCLAQVHRSDGSRATVRVHEWVEGEGLQRVVYGTDFATRVSGVISRIHALAMPAGVTQAEALVTLGGDHWRELAERVERSDAEWKWEFRAILPTLAEIEAYVDRARSDATPLIFGHRDADQKNWMKTAAKDLLLVDWDAAGPVNPRHEVASLALTWAGAHLGEPDWKCVRAWITGYREGGGVLDAIRPTDLADFVAVLSQSFEYNARRAIGERPGDNADRKQSSDIVRRGFKDLPRYMRSVERWTRMLADE